MEFPPVKPYYGKTIRHVMLGEDGDVLFIDVGSMRITLEDHPSCCEYRYFHSDDNLAMLTGQTLRGVELGEETQKDLDSGNIQDSAFLHIKTNLTTATIACYNEHNGYYGGIYPKVTVDDLAPCPSE